ncbi:MAG: 50S ribosomal protein L10 [Clostridia bacterium]|nr:50S ribosomal protein L10 [Clostridia bacterium]
MSSVTRQQKEKQVAYITEQLKAATSFVILDYKGITVAQDTDLRNAFRNAGVKYHVLKNRLVKIALKNLGFGDEFDAALNGTSALAISHQEITAPAKISSQKANTIKVLSIKCGMADGRYLDVEECKALAKLPSKEILIAQLLGMLQAPIASFARAIDAIAQKKAE